MTKMFVHYSGNKAAFAAAKNAEGKLFSEIYNNHIVFIKGENGECIYTHGQYYGDVKAAIAALEGRMSTAEGSIKSNADAIAALKYFSQIKVGDKVAAAANKEGTITFSATDPQEVAIDVDARGISFGLSEAFKNKVNVASEKAAAAAVKADVDASIQALQSADQGLGNRISALEGSIGEGGEGTLSGRMSEAESAISALEGLVGEGTVDSRIGIAKSEAAADATSKADAAESKAKEHANSLNTAMNTRMESAEGKLAVLEGSGDGSVAKALVDAKAYTDAEIVKVNNAASTLEGRVKANEDALVIVNGEGEGSIKKAAADAVATVVAGAHADFDTLKEVADWIKNDTIGATEMQNTIARLDGADTVEGSVKKQVKDAVAAEAAIARAAEQANASNISAEAAKAREEEGKIRNEFASADATLQAAINTKVAQSAYDTQVAALVKADSDNLAAAKKYADDAVAALSSTHSTDKSALEGKITAEENRAKGVENGLNTRLAAVEADYLKAADKSELQSNIDLKVAISDYNAKIAALEAKDAELAGFWAWEEL